MRGIVVDDSVTYVTLQFCWALAEAAILVGHPAGKTNVRVAEGLGCNLAGKGVRKEVGFGCVKGRNLARCMIA